MFAPRDLFQRSQDVFCNNTENEIFRLFATILTVLSFAHMGHLGIGMLQKVTFTWKITSMVARYDKIVPLIGTSFDRTL